MFVLFVSFSTHQVRTTSTSPTWGRGKKASSQKKKMYFYSLWHLPMLSYTNANKPRRPSVSFTSFRSALCFNLALAFSFFANYPIWATLSSSLGRRTRSNGWNKWIKHASWRSEHQPWPGAPRRCARTRLSERESCAASTRWNEVRRKRTVCESYILGCTILSLTLILPDLQILSACSASSCFKKAMN